MTGEEKELVQYLSDTGTVPDQLLKKLVEIRDDYQEKGKDVQLDQLLVANDILSEEEIQQIRSRFEEETDSSVQNNGSPSSSATSPATPSASRGSEGKVRRATGEDEENVSVQAGSEDADVESGEFFSDYDVREVLGKGGTATVFGVEDPETGERRAIKMLYPKFHDSPSHIKQFKREAELLIEFDHPHLVKAYELLKHNDMWCMEMELLEGRTLLKRILREGALEEDRALDIVVEIAAVLQYMQEQGYVHRDVKSENVMLLEDGSTCTFDLGFAQKIGQSPDLDENETQGTVYYMSPEQAKGQKELDVRSDIYSLGVTLYQMAVGDLPFQGDEPREVMAKQVRQELQGEKVKSQLSSHMHYIIEKMMSKEKDFRFQNPAEIIDEITTFRKAQEHMEYEPDEEDTDINPF